MAAIDQPVEHTLPVREAAAACRLSPRTIRRKLNAGAFPNVFRAASAGAPGHSIWRIPVADLERAGLHPVLTHPAFANPVPSIQPDPAGPTVLELVRSDRFGRLRAELAEAVAAAELALLRVEAERWRVIAEERGQALERADVALEGPLQRARIRRRAHRCTRRPQRHRHRSAARARGGDAIHRDPAGAPRHAPPGTSLVALLALEGARLRGCVTPLSFARVSFARVVDLRR